LAHLRCRTRTSLECRARLSHRNRRSHQSCLAEEIDRKITDYFQAEVRLVWVLYPDSGRVCVYQSPTHVSILERTDTLDGGEVLPGFRLPIAQLYEAVAKPA
jgi:Uma2 family endonuclease